MTVTQHVDELAAAIPATLAGGSRDAARADFDLRAFETTVALYSTVSLLLSWMLGHFYFSSALFIRSEFHFDRVAGAVASVKFMLHYPHCVPQFVSTLELFYKLLQESSALFLLLLLHLAVALRHGTLFLVLCKVTEG